MKKDPSLRDFTSAQKRRQFLEKKLNISLEKISNFTFTEEQVKDRNIENLIGSTHIPLGVAGPLKIRTTKYKILNTYIPLATTEGALIASISRGCKALTESGGARVYIEDVGISRGPVFKTKNLEHSIKAKLWIEQNRTSLSQITEKTSSHLKLLNIEISLVSKNLFVRFSFSTSDAMGMNMVTIATQQAVRLIEKETKVKCLALAGNFDIDKKPAWLNFIKGRGKKVWAEIILPKKIVKDLLKTTPENIVSVVKSKAQLGSIMSGSLGFNSHFANIIASLFLATGQDPAHIVEGSLGITDAEIETNGDLYFSIYLPSLLIGTVGGGTNLPSQNEALKIMGVNGEKVIEFASIIGGAILAGELSLIASLAQGSLAKAHQKLGRKGK